MRDGRDPLVLDLMGEPAGHRPGYVISTEDYSDYEDALDPTGKVVTTPGEAARQRYILRLNESWRTMSYAKAH